MRVTTRFTFPYEISGDVAAEFECRASAEVQPGHIPSPFRWPGEPAEPDVVEDFSDVEVDVGGWDAFEKRRIERWVEPDADLRHRIVCWLEEGHMDERFIEAALQERDAA